MALAAVPNAPSGAPAVLLPPAQALAGALWRSPLPVLLLDTEHRIVDANDAFAAYAGRAREALAGCDPTELQPEEDREPNRAARAELLPRLLAGEQPPLAEQRLVDAAGQERWFRIAAQAVRGPDGAPQLLWLLHDCSAEHAARDQAERSIEELTRWFQLSPFAMVLFDDSGLVVRSNHAFEALAGRVPVTLADAPAPLQALLGWQGDRPRPGLLPGAPALETRADIAGPDGRTLRAHARLVAAEAGGARCRYMAVVQDRSAEDERDLAQFEIGALMDAAGIGVATFDRQRGWRRSAAARAAGAGTSPSAGAALASISRDLVEPESRAEYERLQRALRTGERAEVRYAVRHPELGQRWLLTRVEPAQLGAGDSTLSVVTLDVTERELSRARSDELLRELTTILDGSPAGIAYLRDGRLVRCNRRFERMLGFAPGAVAGAALDEVFAHRAAALPAVPQALAALAAGRPFEVEFATETLQAGPQWFSLSLRRAETPHTGAEAVAVLTDITRLKASQAELELLLRERELMFGLLDVGIAWRRGEVIERANEALSMLTGYAPAELTGLPFAELMPDAATAQAFDAQARHALHTRGRYVAELPLKRRDGSARWAQVAMRAVDDADPGAGTVCSFVDIDERQHAREALQRAAGRTRAVLDSVLVGIVTVGDHGIEWMNRSARRMFGGELGEFAGEPIATVATAEADHPLKRTDWLARLAEGQSETFECRLQARDGREFWVVGNAVATMRDAAAGRHVTFALLDIEARRQAEARIARAQLQLAHVIENAPLAIALFDAHTHELQQLNQMAAAFFGRPMAELLGHAPAQWAEWFGADETAALKASLALAHDGDGVRREITRPAGAASRLWDVRFVALAGPDTGAPGQVLLVASDVTETRVAEQQRLAAAIAQREMLVKEVHHRIKNNLQGVAGLLQQSAVRRPEVAAILTEAVGQVQAIAQVYGLQVGGGAALELRRVVEAIAGSVQRTFGRTIDVRCEGELAFDWQLPEGESIPVALTLNELLTNAVKHGSGGAVGCTLRSADDAASIEIVNAGRLREDVDPQRLPGGTWGLGLVRALLPRRYSSLTLAQRGDEVVARVTLRVPSVRSSAA
jgi:PAS domain S-box-containing protein